MNELMVFVWTATLANRPDLVVAVVWLTSPLSVDGGSRDTRRRVTVAELKSHSFHLAYHKNN